MNFSVEYYLKISLAIWHGNRKIIYIFLSLLISIGITFMDCGVDHSLKLIVLQQVYASH